MKIQIAFAAVVFVASPAFAASTPQSAAQAFDAKITSSGVATEVGPFTHVAGQGGNGYQESATGAPENEAVSLLPLNPTPTLYLNLGAVKASASSTGIQLDSESWGAKAEVDSVQASINLNPLPPSGPFPQPFLNITAGSVKADAGLNIVFPSTQGGSSAAKLSHLKITGSALGSTVVHYNGSPAPNTIVFDSPTVTITLNKRTESGLISCSAAPVTCTFTPYVIETDAVDIALNKAPWRGNKYSGHIVIGRATAGQ
jgi:hypothetical protein